MAEAQNPSELETGVGPDEVVSRLEAGDGWHAAPAESALATWDSTAAGLHENEAAKRLAEHGANRLTPPPSRGAVRRFLDQFRNILIYVLLVAAAVSAALGHWLDMSVILGVVVINALIGFLQEGRAERALDAIAELLSLQATVLRDGVRTQVAAETLVPGDVVLLEAGDKVPADLRLLGAKSLRVQEAVLTGESVPVEKSVPPVARAAPLGERSSMAFSGTLVTYGQGRGLVVATGDGTEIGRIGALLARTEPLTTPLLRQMARFGRWLTAAILLLAVVSFFGGTIVHQIPAEEMFLAAVGLVVAAVPEGLPAVMTITLAVGVERMARRRAIIRRIPAVETLGAVSVICSDKTGTFTQNKMTVQSIATPEHLVTVTGNGYEPDGEFLLNGDALGEGGARDGLIALLRGGMLCSDARLARRAGHWSVEGDPTEGALLVAGLKARLEPEAENRAQPRIDEIPFDSGHRFMATLHRQHDGEGLVIVKGAPERLLSMCSRQRGARGDHRLDAAYWRQRMEEMAARGERLLAVASRVLPPGHDSLEVGDVERGLTLLGLFGLADPPRPEAIEAVARCREAGIRVKMITGDHAGTARAVARQLGLESTDKVLTGYDLDQLIDADLAARVREVDVFARTSPEQKLRLVQALQSRGQIVAMTGDGVNDAPALKRADVGVAMGVKGSEAAKEAAQMVLADDNFVSIADAVEEGRKVYDNLRKGIVYILPTSIAEAFTIVVAVMLGLVLPITPVQILWVNMVTAVTLGLALAFEPAEAELMKRPPRRADEPLISGFLLWRTAIVTLVLVAGVFAVFRWHAGNDVETARTAAVNTLVMFEIFYLFNTRRFHSSALSGLFSREAKAVWIAIVLVLLLQALFTYLPIMQFLFRTQALTLETWGLVVALSASIFLLIELEKLATRLMRRRREPVSLSSAGGAEADR